MFRFAQHDIRIDIAVGSSYSLQVLAGRFVAHLMLENITSRPPLEPIIDYGNSQIRSLRRLSGIALGFGSIDSLASSRRIVRVDRALHGA